MPPPKRYTEMVLVRLPEGTRDRIEKQRLAGEGLADAQRRVVLAGLAALESAGVQQPVQNPGAAACQPRAAIAKRKR